MNNFDVSLPSSAEFAFWVGNQDVIMHDEELSASSLEEATTLFEHWQTEDEEVRLMEIDMQLGPNLLDDAIFNSTCCNSPIGPIEELVGLEEEDAENFWTDDSSGGANSLEFSEQYKTTLRKLAESMKKTHESRKSLMIKTPKTEKYERSTSVSGVISSIEKSSEQLQAYLDNIRAEYN
jgi:hypothetical protein